MVGVTLKPEVNPRSTKIVEKKYTKFNELDGEASGDQKDAAEPLKPLEQPKQRGHEALYALHKKKLKEREEAYRKKQLEVDPEATFQPKITKRVKHE